MLARSIYALLVAALAIFATPTPSITSESPCPAILDHKFANLMDEPISLCQFGGKVLLIVNTASECGYTPQYEGLEKLHSELHDKGFNVLGFPSNDFGGQEPGTAEEIGKFCRLTYGVTFPMFEKVVTRQGVEQSPVYGFLFKSGNLPKWNFAKYVVGKDGQVLAFFPSAVTPDDPALRGAISKALAQ